jgi:hypothetical protein
MQARHTQGGFINIRAGVVNSHPTTSRPTYFTVNTTATRLSIAVSVVALAMTAAPTCRFTSFLLALVTEDHPAH